VAIGSEPGKNGDGAGQIPPPRPPKQARSACEEHRAWIEAQVELGRNAQSISTRTWWRAAALRTGTTRSSPLLAAEQAANLTNATLKQAFTKIISSLIALIPGERWARTNETARRFGIPI
jgi:hypothetical protein